MKCAPIFLFLASSIARSEGPADVRASGFRLLASGGWTWWEGGNDGLLGPAEWAQVEGAYCGGLRQSPIDIVTKAVDKKSCPLAITLPKSSAAPECDLDALIYEADGHDWKAGGFENCAVPPQISVCKTDGGACATYALLQFHFHSHSEHTVDGEIAGGELHMVHVNVENPTADYLVLGVLMDMPKHGREDKGENKALEPYWDHFRYAAENPEGEDSLEGRRLRGSSSTSSANPYDLLPHKPTFWTYLGSLTTPGCNEFVTWAVLTQGMAISRKQLEDFREALADAPDTLVDQNGDNARPTQPLNGRVVQQCKLA